MWAPISHLLAELMEGLSYGIPQREWVGVMMTKRVLVF